MSLRSDGVSVRHANAEELEHYDRIAEVLKRSDVPCLYDSHDPSSRVFIALFDGTGNDVVRDPQHASNIGLLRNELEAFTTKNPDTTLAFHYKEGPGTQGGMKGLADGAIGGTYNSRIDDMREVFNEQVNDWLADDPNAKIRVVSVGFSRGAEQAAGFSRVVNERGVEDIDKPTLKLRAPGSIPQAMALYDPVGTGVPSLHDRRPPPSVLCCLQLSAAHEQRQLFPSSVIIPHGVDKDGRFIHFTGAGAHSNIGGSYDANGISSRTYNMTADYLNKVLGEELIAQVPVPADRDLNVIHDSVQHSWIYHRVAERNIIEHRRPIEPVDRKLLAMLARPLQLDVNAYASTEQRVMPARNDPYKNEAAIALATLQNTADSLKHLQNDPTMTRFSMEDLAKIAFYRILVIEREQQSPLATREETLARFDKAMRNPAMVDLLPDQDIKAGPRTLGNDKRPQDNSSEHSL